MFSTLHGTYFSFEMHFNMSSAKRFNLDQSKILLCDNGLQYDVLQFVVNRDRLVRDSFIVDEKAG